GFPSRRPGRGPARAGAAAGPPGGGVSLGGAGGAPLTQALTPVGPTSSQAVFVLTAPAVGDHALLATYPQTLPNFDASSGSATLHVDKGTPTFANLTSPPIARAQTPSRPPGPSQH